MPSHQDTDVPLVDVAEGSQLLLLHCLPDRESKLNIKFTKHPDVFRNLSSHA